MKTNLKQIYKQTLEGLNLSPSQLDELADSFFHLCREQVKANINSNRPIPTQVSTKLKSYLELQRSDKISQNHLKIVECLNHHRKPLSRAQLAELTNLKECTICARVNELLKMGVLEVSNKRLVNYRTAKTVQGLCLNKDFYIMQDKTLWDILDAYVAEYIAKYGNQWLTPEEELEAEAHITVMLEPKEQ